MKKERFKITKFNPVTNEFYFEEVEGQRITVEGNACFIFREICGWNISHLETGMMAALNLLDRRLAIEDAKKNFKNNPGTVTKTKAFMDSKGIKYPVNV